MTKNRLEAFSDGVIAIIITIMVLELRPPHGSTFDALWHASGDEPSLVPKFAAYVLSYVYLGIYWNNHHHLMHAVERVDGAIMWANLHLLFWLSVVPFTTAWMGEHALAPQPAAVYGFSLLMAAIAYTILVRCIIAEQLHHSGGKHSKLRDLLGSDTKGLISIALYIVGSGLSFVTPWIAYALFATVAVIWLVPDRRISRTLRD
jgi:uncharacterized membrane protein